MEIDAAYLRALIQYCNDPMGVLERSNLPGDRENEEDAKNTLMRHFERPLEYEAEMHSAHLKAMRFLGVDIPEDEDVSVVESNKLNGSSSR